MESKNIRKKVGVVLSGSGVFDGTEIYEATLTVYFLDRLGVKPIFIAPNVDQAEVVNHINQEQIKESSPRNVLLESARIARGPVKDIKEASAEGLDAIIFPGGFGAAKNLSDFAYKGADCTINPDIVELVKSMHELKKPQGFMCIAPLIAASILPEVKLTIGKDPATAQSLEQMGANHVYCEVDDIVIDEDNRVITTPAYMLGPTISKVGQGIEKLVDTVVKMIDIKKKEEAPAKNTAV